VILLLLAAFVFVTPALTPESSVESLLIPLELAQAAAFTASVFLARRLLDRRSIVSLGLRPGRQAAADLLAGFLIAFILMGGIYLAMVGLGWSRFESFAWQTEAAPAVLRGTLGMAVFFILVAWSEELLTRGYHLQTISSGLGLGWGVALSSIIFGLMHGSNPGATWVSTLGLVLAGLFLAYGYVATRQLWLPIGLHLGWNFFEGTVFGFPVSGLDIYRIVRHAVVGPELWTGGAFGPEAGLIVLPALALGAALIYLYSSRLRPAPR
jgi:membrane protease YdiL (CAAX protease family)